jgi:hypothetical protein
MMTEHDILIQQKLLPEEDCLLIMVDGFYQAYGLGAFALARVMKYRVLRRHRPWGEVLTCGFPDLVLAKVCLRLRKTRADVELLGDNAFLVHGLNGEPDESQVWDADDDDTPMTSEPTLCVTEDWLADAVTGFNAEEATPEEAMLFVKTLQKRLSQTTSCHRY